MVETRRNTENGARLPIITIGKREEIEAEMSQQTCAAFVMKGRFLPQYRSTTALPGFAPGAASFALIIGLHLLGGPAWLVTYSFFFWGVCIGVNAIARTSQRLGDPRIKKLCWLHIVKMCVIIPLLSVAWIPYLVPGSPDFGYDPQRYYFQAIDVSQSVVAGSVTAVTLVTKYPGIIYYYATMFLILPSDPVVPAIANTLVTLAATLLLLRVGYALGTPHVRTRWTLGLYMVCPEVVWFDCLTSKETLVSACCVAIIASMYMMFGSEKRQVRRRLQYLAMIGVSTAALLVVRTTALIPVAAALLGRTTVFSSRRARFGLGLAVTAVICLMLYVAPVVNQRIGAVGYESARSIFEFGGGNMQWKEDSFGRLITPDSALARLYLFPLRSLGYLLQPLRSVSEIAHPYNWLSYEYVAEAAASVVYIIFFPFVILSLPLGNRLRAQRYAWLVFPFWAWVMTLAVGTVEFHARYRVMAVPFLFACMWLGRGAEKKALERVSILWVIVLVSAAVVYVVFKWAG